MSRPHRDFVDLADIEETTPEGPFAGASKRSLSLDGDTGAETAVLTLPAGWSAGLSACEGSLELLSLDGAVTLGGEPVPEHGWARAPIAGEAGELSAPNGAELLVMTDPTAAPEAELTILDVRALPWQQGVRGGPGGVAVKTLYEGSTISLVIGNIPRYWSGAEFHSCPEELYVLEGDVTGSAGAMTVGSYFWRPEWITHGPYWSETGLLTFVRGHGDLVAHWIGDPGSTVEQNREIFKQIEASA